MRKVLLVAYHFPPIRVSSGIQRTLSMARYLEENGWEPIVLSISPAAYQMVSYDQLKDIPDSVLVRRAFGRDTSRSLSIKGRYPRVLALPDRWVSWLPGALISGLKLIREEKPDLIWSTYPIATTHLIGLALKILSGLPWVADFRDSMTEDNYPRNVMQRRVYRWIEKKVMKHASQIVFTTRSTENMYKARYPNIHNNIFNVVPNGYDEEIFLAAEAKNNPIKTSRGIATPLRLLHSGVVYPSERDPTSLFEAVSELKFEGKIGAQCLDIVMRATGHDELYEPMLEKLDIEDIISLKASIGYEEALAEMNDVDGLMLLQASTSNHQIPAKVYEYFRSGRPIIALTDPLGDTAQVIRDAGITAICNLDDKESIKNIIMQFINEAEFRKRASASKDYARIYSRRSLIKTYSGILNKSC